MSRFQALISLTGASIIVGSTLVVSRIISGGESIYCIQLFSMFIASIILFFLIGKDNIKKELKNTTRKDFIIFFLQTLSGVVLFRIFIVYGVGLTKAMDAGVILSLTPVTTVILSVIFLKDKLGKREIIALLCAFVGVLIINLNGIQESTEGNMRLLGNAMILMAVLGESSFVIFSKKASVKISPLTRSLMICICGIFLFFPLSIYELTQGYSFLMNLNFWILTLYTGVVLTVMAYVLWFRGISHVSGTTAGVFNSLIPVSAIALVFIFLGEAMTKMQLAGLIFILAGVGLIIFEGNLDI
ncbi:DMT family transporter [Clostridium sediminicola]|uniref:DMT family transporter n=1 Tax=Clostridium sediminicola TaxID=3114879 RepID=UPI0031F270E8